MGLGIVASRGARTAVGATTPGAYPGFVGVRSPTTPTPRATTISEAAKTSLAASRGPNARGRSCGSLNTVFSSRSGGGAASSCVTSWLTAFPSARPRVLGEIQPMTLPMSRGDAAPVSAMACSTRAFSSPSESGWGMNSETTAMAASSLATRSSRPPARNVSTDSRRTLSSRVRIPSISSSASSCLPSFSARWTAASTMRSESRRMASLDRMAAFSSSSSRLRRDTGVAPLGGRRGCNQSHDPSTA